TGHHCGRMETGTQDPGSNDFSFAYAPPYRCGFNFRIAACQQQLRLMRTQASTCFRARWPPAEAALGQALGGEPESLPVIGQDPDRTGAAVAEDEQAAGKRIGVQFLPAELRKGIYTLASVDRLNGDQYAQLRGDLDHNTNSAKLRLKLTTSAALAL